MTAATIIDHDGHRLAPTLAGQPPSGGRSRLRFGALQGVVALLCVLVSLLASATAVHAAPQEPTVDAACAQKAPGSVAWCMPWAVRVDAPPAGGGSHWVTQCSKATSDEDREECADASLSLDSPPVDGVASVLMDGPTDSSGLAGLVNCSLFGAQMLTEPDLNQRARWRNKQAACTTASGDWAKAGYDPDPKPKPCPEADVTCRVQESAEEAVESGVRSGIQGLVDAVVQAEVYLLSKLAELVFTETSIAAPDQAFYGVYNSVAGTVALLIFLFFLISTIINGLRTSGGPGPLATLGGLVKAIIGITVAGGIAYAIVLAWDQAAAAALQANADTPWDPSRPVEVITKYSVGAGTLILAGLFGLLGIVGLILLMIIMLFRGMLATAAALFGAMAMAGLVMDQTRHWPRRWFWTVNALASSKYWMVQIWIYAGRSVYESDDLTTVLQSLLMIWLMVLAPFILLKITSVWDGYLSDVNAHGMLAAFGGPLQIGADFVGGTRQGASGGGSDDAASVMDANSSETPTNPAAMVGQATGISPGFGDGVAQAASIGKDGGEVGLPVTDSPDGSVQRSPDGARDQVGKGSGGEPATSTSAQHDTAAAQVTSPGGTTRDGESARGTPRGTDPTGVTPESAPASGAGDSGDPASGDESGDLRSGVASAGPAGAGPVPNDVDTTSSGTDTAPRPASGGAGERDENTFASGESQDGATTSGGAQGANAVADVPSMPLKPGRRG